MHHPLEMKLFNKGIRFTKDDQHYFKIVKTPCGENSFSNQFVHEPLNPGTEKTAGVYRYLQEDSATPRN